MDNELRAANTGAPLDAEGVAALASLRASAKRDILGTVGQFGVGFSAVLSVTDEPEVVSTTGSVRFSAQRTREIPEIQKHVAARSGQVPVLRMVWPTDSVVPEGFDTRYGCRYGRTSTRPRCSKASVSRRRTCCWHYPV
ncbi:sacsin N-terminal ATP-binding-like domain-containing protein [Kibdelosporangium philippinense]|uniref:sacsin N-terminal ATP-binding-like domain-containing protein n=1 Tax=Kibdelosporangium philippinense TaxID=211113 RepID=UPI00361CCD0B